MKSTKSTQQKSGLRVLFFGTPEFAVPSLQQCIQHFNVVGCVTQPDKPAGRNRSVQHSVIKTVALENNIPVHQPTSIRERTSVGKDFLELCESLHIDIAVVVAYGKIIPPELLKIPTHGFVNVHASLLPKHRGASPIQSAILQGDSSTGVTIMLLDEGMDTGPILSQKKVTISPADTSSTVHDSLKDIGADLLIPTMQQYISGEIEPRPQDDAAATETEIIKKTDGEICWTDSPEVIDRQIRAYTPWPGAYTFCNNKRIIILSAHLEEDAIIIDTVQPENKKPMSYTDFIHGYPDCSFQ